MRYLFLFLVFLCSFVLKVSTVLGAPQELIAAEEKSQVSSGDDVIPVEAQKRSQLALTNSPKRSSEAVITKRASNLSSNSSVSISPMAGRTWYRGGWDTHIGNYSTFGVLVEMPLASFLSLESELSYSKSNITYSGLIHDFDLFGAGLSAKFSPLQGGFRPYLGAGLMALHYSGMWRNRIEHYDQMVGSTQVFVGADVRLFSSVSVGARGSWVNPVFNRPTTSDDGVHSTAGFEEAGAINTQFVRVMGTVKIDL